jgi:adenylate cyclase
LFLLILTQGHAADSLTWVQEMLEVATEAGDVDLRITGHTAACICYTWLGEFTKSVEHADKVLDLCDAEKHRHLVDILGHDPRTVAGIYASISAWMLGYPDRALRFSEEKDLHARRCNHPFDLGFALTMGVHEFDRRYNHEDLRKRAEECERLGRDNSLPVLWAILAPFAYGQALIREGKVAEGIAPLKAGIAFWNAGGRKVRGPTLNAFLGEAMALTGDLDNALRLLEEPIIQIERPGWEERRYCWRIQAPGQAANCRAAKCDMRVLAVGVPSCHSAILTTLIAAAVMTCCRRALANPIYRHLRKPHRRVACECVPSMPAREA